MSDIYKIIDRYSEFPNLPPEYVDKMMHKVPEAPSVSRADWVLERCKERVVLDIGCAGPFHEKLRKVARDTYGIDKEDFDAPNYFKIDLDKSNAIPVFPAVDLVFCGETLEHLSNPGRFLQMLKRYECEKIITVPNAFSEAARSSIKGGIEQVNRDHVFWFSWQTMTTLLGRYGYQVNEFLWYGGHPLTAEGLIFVVI